MSNQANKSTGIGLALSGGGQRAAAFHLGVLKKLQALGILQKVSVISSVSGGSILAAYYGLKISDFEKMYLNFYNKLKINLERRLLLTRDFIWKIILLIGIIAGAFYFLLASNYLILLMIIICLFFIVKYSLLIFPTGKALQRVYDKLFYDHNNIVNLPNEPKFIFNSTNLQTGTLMTFTKTEISDSSYKYAQDGSEVTSDAMPYFDTNEIPISMAVTASSSFAPIISPITFNEKQLKLSEKAKKRNINPELADGGIYDNQGVYKLIKEKMDIIICSDASSPYDKSEYSAINIFGLLMRTLTTLMKRIKSFQFINTIYERPDIKEVAYFSINWDYKTCLSRFARNILDKRVKPELIKYHKIPSEFIEDTDESKKDLQIENIAKYMNEKLGYEKLLENALKKEVIEKISNMSTRLKGLRRKEIDNLIKHGEMICEIHLRLYCPSIMEGLALRDT